MTTLYTAPIHLSPKRGGVIRPTADCPMHGIHTAHPAGGCVQCRIEDQQAADQQAADQQAADAVRESYLYACRLYPAAVTNLHGVRVGTEIRCSAHGYRPSVACRVYADTLAAAAR